MYHGYDVNDGYLIIGEGGNGSGNFNHKGRRGKRGGSISNGSSSNGGTTINDLSDTLKKNKVDYTFVGGVATAIYLGKEDKIKDVDVIITDKDGKFLDDISNGKYKRYKPTDYDYDGNLISFTDTTTKINIQLLDVGKEYNGATGSGFKINSDFKTNKVKGKDIIDMKSLIAMKLNRGRDKDIIEVEELIKKYKLSPKYLNDLKSITSGTKQKFLLSYVDANNLGDDFDKNINKYKAYIK